MSDKRDLAARYGFETFNGPCQGPTAKCLFSRKVTCRRIRRILECHYAHYAIS